MAYLRTISMVAVCLILTPTLSADEVSIGPSRDNSLFENFPRTVSNGAGPYVFVGNTAVFAAFSERRAVMAFDIASNIPAGATVEMQSPSMRTE